MEVIFDSSHISIEKIGQISKQSAKVKLGTNHEFVERIKTGPEVVQKLIDNGTIIYGVSTGFGDSCVIQIPNELLEALQVSAIVQHGVAMGDYFSPEETRAILAARIISLAKGFSGIRMELLQQLVKLLQYDILPRIPKKGSVGASGDLSPLSYVGAVLCGERDVLYDGKVVPALEALEKGPAFPAYSI